MDNKTLQNIREEYAKEELDLEHVVADPLKQFATWFQEALDSEVMEPTAMTLSTCSKDGKPTGRVVLLKGVDHGFQFFTNYTSKKALELTANPNAALNFFWPALERQVRIEGVVERLSAEESDEYYFSRPYESQLGAHASPQSQEIDSREVLKEKMKGLQASFTPETIKRPETWGGFRLVPNYVEYWQGRPSRLHDRICYELVENSWRIFRVAP